MFDPYNFVQPKKRSKVYLNYSLVKANYQNPDYFEQPLTRQNFEEYEERLKKRQV